MFEKKNGRRLILLEAVIVRYVEGKSATATGEIAQTTGEYIQSAKAVLSKTVSLTEEEYATITKLENPVVENQGMNFRKMSLCVGDYSPGIWKFVSWDERAADGDEREAVVNRVNELNKDGRWEVSLR